jgi:hypothetical protein
LIRHYETEHRGLHDCVIGQLRNDKINSLKSCEISGSHGGEYED